MERFIDVAGTGFTVLDRVYVGEAATEALGGSCGNVLVSLAMLSHSVAPVLVLGADDVGDQLVSTFEAAGADTRYIVRRREVASPVLAQQLDEVSGRHWFTTTCPDTAEQLPRYTSIVREDVDQARSVIRRCSVFYADRISDAIVEAMEAAYAAGAIVYFEPSTIDDETLFERALRVTRILKYSSDRLAEKTVTRHLQANAISIVTYGAAGLEVLREGERHWCDAVPAERVRDTCGSGDMVSVGLIDWLLGAGRSDRPRTPSMLLHGIRAGQRLAAANCAFAGARGVFHRYGAHGVRAIMDGCPRSSIDQVCND